MGYTPCERWLIIRAVLNLPQAVFFSFMKKAKTYISWYCVWFYLISHDISQRDTFLFRGNHVGGSSPPLLLRTCERRSFQGDFCSFILFVGNNYRLPTPNAVWFVKMQRTWWIRMHWDDERIKSPSEHRTVLITGLQCPTMSFRINSIKV